MNIYVGNLSDNLTEKELRKVFKSFGRIESTNIIKNSVNGASMGFGYVEMPSLAEACSAIDHLNGQKLKGRNLIVNEALSW